VETTKIGRRGTVVIPAKLRKQLGLDEGDLMIAEAVDGGVLLRPAAIAPTTTQASTDAFFQNLSKAYAELQRDAKAWQEYVDEIREWDETLMDGLDADEVWGPDGRPL
jgi:AbrB family looped-hinge helix DNA binding protein